MIGYTHVNFHSRLFSRALQEIFLSLFLQEIFWKFQKKNFLWIWKLFSHQQYGGIRIYATIRSMLFFSTKFIFFEGPFWTHVCKLDIEFIFFDKIQHLQLLRPQRTFHRSFRWAALDGSLAGSSRCTTIAIGINREGILRTGKNLENAFFFIFWGFFVNFLDLYYFSVFCLLQLNSKIFAENIDLFAGLGRMFQGCVCSFMEKIWCNFLWNFHGPIFYFSSWDQSQ